jgi:hypothetical protein
MNSLLLSERDLQEGTLVIDLTLVAHAHLDPEPKELLARGSLPLKLKLYITPISCCIGPVHGQMTGEVLHANSECILRPKIQVDNE